ncbi:type II secretion system GspH family protein [Candidatus Saccharibacteria bacterium]|nr:type II secretion system GspH family protein [Candidatus Saccharibacteria bacterium]
MKTRKGFTAIELALVALVFSAAVVFFFVQKANVDALNRDEKSKIAINAMYYDLEEVYYKAHGYYPAKVNENDLTAIDPQLFTDPYGYNIGDSLSSYRYEPTGCTDNKCTSYTLRATLEKEDDFIKSGRH